MEVILPQCSGMSSGKQKPFPSHRPSVPHLPAVSYILPDVFSVCLSAYKVSEVKTGSITKSVLIIKTNPKSDHNLGPPSSKEGEGLSTPGVPLQDPRAASGNGPSGCLSGLCSAGTRHCPDAWGPGVQARATGPVTWRLQLVLVVGRVGVERTHQRVNAQSEDSGHHHVESRVVQADPHCGERQVRRS